ncbi:hypothetical protein ACRYCC_32725 [Actinomadura scrupuli]|uniref:hypothetical protein n=1 Tax=Actinomadura scrupuli TaxID=559629 RepID=UPI003D98345E
MAGDDAAGSSQMVSTRSLARPLGRDRGSVTAETMIIIPVLILVLSAGPSAEDSADDGVDDSRRLVRPESSAVPRRENHRG